MDTVPDASGMPQTYRYDWYPSEYLYLESKGKYCVGADIMERNEVMFGGTLMH
jgi:hypothetical protein